GSRPALDRWPAVSSVPEVGVTGSYAGSNAPRNALARIDISRTFRQLSWHLSRQAATPHNDKVLSSGTGGIRTPDPSGRPLSRRVQSSTLPPFRRNRLLTTRRRPWGQDRCDVEPFDGADGAHGRLVGRAAEEPVE